MQAVFMYPAAASGEVDVITAYTSDGRIDQFALRVLNDPKQATSPYDAILQVSPQRTNDAEFLRSLVDAVPVTTMRQANRRMGEGTSAENTARWLAEMIVR